MSRPTGQRRDGAGPLGAGFNTTGAEEEDTPLLSRPKRNFRASYMLTAFLSTLFTITDWEVEERLGRKSQRRRREEEEQKTGRECWHQTWGVKEREDKHEGEEGRRN